MSIVGMQESFIDYPDEICVMLFTKTCTWDCVNCHNKHNLLNADEIPMSEIVDYLKKSSPLITHVTISGGEPCDDPGIIKLVKTVHDLGFKIKLDTNGSKPNVLKELLPYLSVVAMDVKNKLDSYQAYTDICKCSYDEYHKVLCSLEFLSDWCKSGGYLLLRTTLLDPSINPDEVKRSLKPYTFTKYVVQSEII